jgi:Fe-Mn family superoxide dismutase
MKQHCSRRDFIKSAAAATAAAALTSPHGLFAQTAQPAAPQTKVFMIKLPYAENALEPYISARTVNLHYTKHHQSYYTLLKGWLDTRPEFQNRTLEELILKNKNGIMFEEAIFQYSILLNNHNWYWQSLKPKAGGAPRGNIEKMIVASYGSLDGFHKKFIDEAMQLGAGWVWVVQDGDALKVYRSEYRDTPLLKGYKPLLAIDVWEHAYYLDYQNERRKYIEAILGNLLNWEFAETNLTRKG